MAKRALITGITGQDGALLAKLLLDKGYEVFGALRTQSTGVVWRLHELGIYERISYVQFDMLDYAGIEESIRKIQPHEVYNLASQSFVGASFQRPLYAGEVNGMAVARILEAVRQVNPSMRVLQASTSEMFGIPQSIPQHEATPFHPRSPYGVAKLYGHYSIMNYREQFKLHACSAILYNHESSFRGQEFVTRKITLGLARITLGLQEELTLGNMEACRDWGFAEEYVEGMWRMLQQEKPDDYILSTGRATSVRSFVDTAADCAGLRLEWLGTGIDMQAIDRDSGKCIVRVNPEFYRPVEAHQLVGDPAKANRVLGWRASSDLQGLCSSMVRADIDRLSQSRLLG